jgi:hypothetical protein
MKLKFSRRPIFQSEAAPPAMKLLSVRLPALASIFLAYLAQTAQRLSQSILEMDVLPMVGLV